MAIYINEKSDDFSLVDLHSGEMHDYNVPRKIEPEEFVMVFFSSCRDLMSLQGNQLKVLICCWKHSSYTPQDEEQGNIIHNCSGFKRACKDDGLDISNASIDNAISELCKKGFLIKKFRGEYMLNPHYFYRGKLKNREKVKLPSS